MKLFKNTESGRSIPTRHPEAGTAVRVQSMAYGSKELGDCGFSQGINPPQNDSRRRIMQSGRSMVEMLGVLAIVGVLSVGGIAGYKMAMEKHWENQIFTAYNIALVRFYELLNTVEKTGKYTSTREKVGPGITMHVHAQPCESCYTSEWEDEFGDKFVDEYCDNVCDSYNVANPASGSIWLYFEKPVSKKICEAFFQKAWDDGLRKYMNAADAGYEDNNYYTCGWNINNINSFCKEETDTLGVYIGC